MSHRPINQKRANKLRKALRNTPPAYISLSQWLIDHKHAQTPREAREMMLAGRVKVDSHTVGVEEYDNPLKKDEKIKVIVPHVKAELRSRLMVV